MIEILRSLSLRCKFAMAVTVVLLSVALRLIGQRVTGLGLALAWIASITIALVAFWVLYHAFGLVCRTPAWRGRIDATRFRAPAISVTPPAPPRWAPAPLPGPGRLKPFIDQNNMDDAIDDTKLSIGIVLAGGGAKGVYQAGALTALHEFLAAEGALKYVRAIAGTSIGSWNAMFWLTDQVQNGDLRDWWASAAPQKLVGPALYLPGRNFVLDNAPWRRQFDDVFEARPKSLLAPPKDGPFFYFTRTNVANARLELTTNHRPSDPYYKVGADGRYSVAGSIIDTAQYRYPATGVDDVKLSVFASMDIPPAFRRLSILGAQCEDGGVIDNLPIRYVTRLDGCNLIFVFPLNATFDARVSRFGLMRRMSRVMDIRQGVLENDAIRDIYLYNELIEAGRNRDRDVHIKPVTTFCICPEPPLEIGTFEFWKTKKLGPAVFQLMYEATRDQLARFDFSTTNHDVWMARVAADGRVTYKNYMPA